MKIDIRLTHSTSKPEKTIFDYCDNHRLIREQVVTIDSSAEF